MIGNLAASVAVCAALKPAYLSGRYRVDRWSWRPRVFGTGLREPGARPANPVAPPA
jgi:hypothetical protein